MVWEGYAARGYRETPKGKLRGVCGPPLLFASPSVVGGGFFIPPTGV